MFLLSHASSYEEGKQKSNFIHQYTCCGHKWWGADSNNTCKSCKKTVAKLSFAEMIGVAWFKCECGLIYAGFCHGNVRSKCHGCERKNFPEFIVPGDEAGSSKREKTHHCEMCHGVGHCPLVASALKHKR